MWFLLVWRLALESCTVAPVLRPLRADRPVCGSFWPHWICFSDHGLGEMRVCQTLIRQEGREWGWARRGNSREGWKPKVLVPKGDLETCFSFSELTSLKQLSLLLIELSFHIQMGSFPLSCFGQLDSRSVHNTGRGGAFPKCEFLYCC